MICDPYEIKQLHQERLKRDEQERLARQVMAEQPTLFSLLLAKVGDVLIAAGTRLRREMRATVPRAQ